MSLDFLILYEHTVREYESDLLSPKHAHAAPRSGHRIGLSAFVRRGDQHPSVSYKRKYAFFEHIVFIHDLFTSESNYIAFLS